MPLEENQVRNDGRILGFSVNGLPSAATPNLRFNDATKEFDWISDSENSGMQRKVKKVGETRTNNADTSDDSELIIPVKGDKIYGFMCMMKINSSAVPDFRYRFGSPIGTTGTYHRATLSGVSAGATNPIATIAAIVTNNTTQFIVTVGFFKTNVTPGNFTLQWSQNTADPSDTTLGRGSYLVVWEETS